MPAPAQIAAVRRLHAAGWSARDIASLQGLARADVRAILASVPADKSGGRRRLAPDQRDAEIRKLRDAGWSVPALAERFGIAASTVSRIIPGRRAAGAQHADPDVPIPRPTEAARPAPTETGDEKAEALEAQKASEDNRLSGWSTGFAPATGSENGRAKLTEPDVAELRRLRAEDPRRWTYPALGRRFGISRSNVFHILAGRTWRPPS